MLVLMPQDSRATSSESSQNTRPLLPCSTERYYRRMTVKRLVLYMYPVRCHYSRQLRCVHFISFKFIQISDLFIQAVGF